MKSQKLSILLVFLLLTIATSADTKASSSQVQLDTICGKWLVVQVYVGAFTFPAKAILPDGAANPYIVYGGPHLVAGNYYCIYDPVIELISPPDRTPDGYSISQKITGWSTIEPAGGQLPSAEFDAWPQSGSAPLRVSMHIVLTDNISSCLWEYGDGTTGTSCDAYHDHVYTSGGSYTVKLTVTGPSGSNTMTRSSYIAVTAATVCYTLTKGVNPSNTGSIIAFPIPNCADGKYAAGTQLSLVATPLSGYQFTSWSGSLSGNANPATLLMDADKSVTATFSQSSFCNAVTEIPQTECEALITFYNSTNGAGWSNNDNWLDTTSPCSWFGVVCNNNHVVQLVLPNNQLNGALPQQLSALTNLQVLSLYVNQLSGPIPPALGSLANLISMSLSDNQLSGSIPTSFGSLSNLQLLHAHGNQFIGNIPTQLGSLTNLLELDLASNQLSGSIPVQLGSLLKLEKLGLGSNQLSGNIPSEIGKLTKLVGINLSNNQLSGQFPAQMGDLSNLDFLSIENNQFSGSLPGNLTNLNKLVHFWFNNTNLCEPGDNSFQSWLARISDLNRTGVICTTPPTALLSGKVTKWDGNTNDKPVTGVQIKIKNDLHEYTTTTNQEGIYSLQIPHGVYQIIPNLSGSAVYYEEENIDGLVTNNIVQPITITANIFAKPYIALPCLSPATKLNICNLKKGDILLMTVSNIDAAVIGFLGSYWYHTGFTDGNGNILEASSPLEGIQQKAIQYTGFYAQTGLHQAAKNFVVLRVKPEFSQYIDGAVTWGIQKANDQNVRYLGSNKWFDPNNKNKEDEFYCSLFVWKAYYVASNGKLDLDSNLGALRFGGLFSPLLNALLGQVLPDDIFATIEPVTQGKTVPTQYNKIDFNLLKVILLSPADLYIVDSLGHEIGRNSSTGEVVNTFPDAFYSGPGIEPEWINITEANMPLTVTVTGTDSGNYTLGVQSFSSNKIIADAKISTVQRGQTDVYLFDWAENGEQINIKPVSISSRLYLPLITK